jgi:hypothetical protein
MFEAPQPEEGSERITSEEVIESLRTNPEDLSKLLKYLEAREKEVTSSKETLNLNIKIAEIYRDAGLKEAALKSFEDAATQAWNENEDTLYEQLMDEADKLRE